MWSVPSLPRTLEAALRDLRERLPRVRASAAADLSRHGDPSDRARVSAALIGALADEAPEVRARAAASLGELAEGSAVDRLLDLVEDVDALVRQAAIEALGVIGDARAVERLRQALREGPPEVRFQAAVALPRLVDEAEAERLLARATADDDALVRHIALRVLEERLAGPSGSPPAELPAVAAAAARARLGDPSPDVRAAAALLLARAGDTAGADVLLAVVEGHLEMADPDDEAAAVEAAGTLGLRAALGALERRAFGPARFFRERFPLVARTSLALLGHERARGEIMRDLGSWSRERRHCAVVAAGRARLGEARGPLQEMARREGSADPQAVAEALARIGESEAL
ncbi:MAG: HEAT repeat domain-containing protein [Polyangiaceae bacterium]|nr:HEAT repeat domain-containing protein [Polyangiaceae bacterium]